MSSSLLILGQGAKHEQCTIYWITFPHIFQILFKRHKPFVIGVGCLVLVGWALDITALKSILPGLASMKSNAALLFVLCGISLWMQINGQTGRITQACTFIVAFVGLLTLGAYIFNTDFGIDELLFNDTAVGALYPGRMAPPTALVFLMIGLALMFLDRQQKKPFNESLLITAFAISMLALIGYIYGVSSLYKIGEYTSMALHTALNFILLSISILFARPERGLMHTILADTAGGRILRRFLPVVIVGPILLGSIRLLGQRAGLYDTAFGLALMVVSFITTLTVFIWFNARQLTNIDINRNKADATLLEREMKLSTLFEILPVGISILDGERKVSYTNPALKKILDLTEEGLLKGTYRNRKYLRADGTSMPVDELASMRAFKEQREIDSVETGVVKEDEGIIWTNVSAVPVDFPDWKLVVVTSDITERKQAEMEILKLNAELEGKVAERTAALAEANTLLQTMMEHIPDHIFFKDVEGRFIRNSKSQTKMLGLSDPMQAIGKTDFDFFPHAQRSFDEEQKVIRSGQPLIGNEESVVWPDGHKTWLSTTKVPLRDKNGKIIGTFGIGRDITDRKHAEVALQKANEQLHELSIIDQLTGLYNRRGFLLLAEQQLLLARRTKRNLLVFYADLDGLKQINDHLGHIAGDEAIVVAARILNETFRTSDIKARLGGDEFIVMVVEAQEHDAQILLARLHEKLAKNNQSMSVGVVAVEAQDEISINDIIARADEAMYVEKRSKTHRREA